MSAGTTARFCDATGEVEAGPVGCQRRAGHEGPHMDDSPGDGQWHYWGPPPTLTCPEGSPDYVECSCGNDPISSRGFVPCSATGSDDDGAEGVHFIRCEDCGAVYDAQAIDAADGVAGATFEPVEVDGGNVVQMIHVTETQGFGSSWRVVCRCGWRRAAAGGVGYATQAEARAAGDAHLAETNGRVTSDA